MNCEKFLSFSIGNLRFLDSCQFLTASLDSLVSTLLKSGQDKFVHTRRHLGQSDLLLCKGVFPYEHLQSRANFEETELPPRESFYSKLNEEAISEADYERAQLMWKTFNCKTLRDYHDLYLTTDVLLLADVFENFRQLGLAKFGLTRPTTSPCRDSAGTPASR